MRSLGATGKPILFFHSILILLALHTGFAEGQMLAHRFKFFLHPDLANTLSADERRERLALYVEDLNAIFARQTSRRFLFDPEKDIIITNQVPYTGYGPEPSEGFENLGACPTLPRLELWDARGIRQD
jgi:hypothetical protein